MDGTQARTDVDTRIGRVVSVSGSQVVILLDAISREDAGLSPLSLQIGSLVKMLTPGSAVFGLVSGLSIPIPDRDSQNEMKVVELELLGETTPNSGTDNTIFRRGVSVYPGLGDGVFEASQEDLRLVYDASSKPTVRIGALHQDRQLPASIVTDDLLGKHFAILGTTGTGKSCAVALILRCILAEYTNGHILLLDVHNEYSCAFGDMAEVLAPGNLELPYWLLNFEEIVEIVIGSGHRDREAEITTLNEVIVEAKRIFAGIKRDEVVTVDTPIPYRLGDVNRLLDEAMGKLDKPSDSVPYRRLKSRLQALQADPRYAFMFPGLSVRDNMSAILSRLFRIPVNGKPVTIVDLSGVPSEIMNVVVSVLCRMTFDFALWSERAAPMLLVCEEAHRYAPQDDALGFEPTKRALARIAKEGRKYGVSLCVVSQRPSELASGMLSQCNTIFALRMTNQKDREFVRAAMAESGVGLLDFLPSLRNAEAIAVGEGVAVPMRICFDSLPEDKRPRSGTAAFSQAWQQDQSTPESLAQIVGRWRRQRR